MCRLRLVTFDVVKTLLKVRRSPGYHYANAAQQNGILIHQDAIDTIYRAEWTKMKRQHPNYGVSQGMTTNQWWEEFVRRVFLQAGFNGKESHLTPVSDQLYEEFAAGDNWELIPGSLTVLQTLKAQGLNIGVISNFDDRLEATLKKHDIMHFFDFIVTCVSAKCEKPDPGIFQAALQAGKAKASETGHIGDDIRDDYYGSIQMGMHGFLLDPDKKYVPFDKLKIDRGYRIEQLTDVLDIVELKEKCAKQN